MSKCIITLPSMTFAQKARKILTANDLEVTARKLTPEQAEKGCGWGIALSCSQTEKAVRVLNVSDIPWKRILRE